MAVTNGSGGCAWVVMVVPTSAGESS